jgi:cytoskeleton protein RodZ
LTEPLGVGAELKQAREALGLSVDDVAQQLKFAPRQIESLEHERFERLPGPTIARGMVRNYARLLKLDSQPLLERMAPKVEKAPDPGLIAARFRQPVPFSDGAKRSTLMYAGFSIGILLLVAAVVYEWRHEKAKPEAAAAALPPKVQPIPAQTASATQAAPVSVMEPPPSAVEDPAQAKPQAQAQSAMVKPAAVREKVERPMAPGVHRIVLRVVDNEAWLEVKDGAGRMLISSLNAPGSERIVRGRPPFEIVIGNASSVRLVHNDKPVDLKPYTKVEVARFILK